MTWWLFGIAASLLALERIAYVWIWRHPATFREWCARSSTAWMGDPVEVVRMLFLLFKGIQGGVFLAWVYAHSDGAALPPPGGAWAVVAGGAAVLVGQSLTATAFFKLGKAGVFYGNQFGHDVSRCRQFPYSVLSHPQYVGAVLTIWGLFLMLRFPAADWYLLPLLETVYYGLGARLEQ